MVSSARWAVIVSSSTGTDASPSLLANPKSITLTRPCWVSMMLEGFRSRWTKLLECASSSPRPLRLRSAVRPPSTVGRGKTSVQCLARYELHRDVEFDRISSPILKILQMKGTARSAAWPAFVLPVRKRAPLLHRSNDRASPKTLMATWRSRRGRRPGRSRSMPTGCRRARARTLHGPRFAPIARLVTRGASFSGPVDIAARNAARPASDRYLPAHRTCRGRHRPSREMSKHFRDRPIWHKPLRLR